MPDEAEVKDTTYSISVSALFLRDDEGERHDRLMYHISSGDYFNMVATILGFLEESLQQRATPEEELEARELKLARELREDLRYLNEHFCIQPKEKGGA